MAGRLNVVLTCWPTRPSKRVVVDRQTSAINLRRETAGACAGQAARRSYRWCRPVLRQPVIRAPDGRDEADPGWAAGSTWCSCVGPTGRRSVSSWTGQTSATNRPISAGRPRGLAPVTRRGARTGGAGRLPRVAPRSCPFRAGTPPSAPAHPCSETDASVTRGSVVREIGFQNPTEMALTEDDDVVERLPP
jgi:hypothetical protein